MALELDKALPKAEILARYLNLVSFGNGSFGVQDAAKTYFGVNAADLNWQQSALLAGMVQSTSTLNPYTNPEAALARRNLVLDTLIQNLPDKAAELQKARAAPLGILARPAPLPQGCIGAGDRAFFCDYALSYLAAAGITKDDLARNGYLIRTTLDPKVQDSVKQAIDEIASPDLEGVASVMSVIKPGRDAHRVLAMGDNRTYGLDLRNGQTVQPQPFTTVGDGGGSTFKVFTTAAALEMGMGIKAQLDVPATFQGAGLGDSNTPGCPPRTWCVKNAGGGGRGPMSVTDALAQSPNTAFAKLIQQVSVPRAVDMAVRLGLRSYAEPGSARDYDPNFKGSLADYVKQQNLGSFTLGPLELTRWRCPMSPRRWRRAACGVRQVRSTRCSTVVAAKCLSRKRSASRSYRRALPTRWPTRSARTTQAVRRPVRPGPSAGTFRWQARPAPRSPIARRRSSGSPTSTPPPTTSSTTPLRRRSCARGRYAGAPAETSTAATSPRAPGTTRCSLSPTSSARCRCPRPTPAMSTARPTVPLPSISGLKFDAARKKLQDAGFQVADQPSPVDSYM